MKPYLLPFVLGLGILGLAGGCDKTADDGPAPPPPSNNTPAVRVRVKLIRLTQCPALKPDTTYWDTHDTLPDVYFRVTSTTGTVYWDNAAAVLNQFANAQLPINIPIPEPDVNTTFIINNLPSRSVYIDFYDKDGSGPGEYIGYCGFDAELYRTQRPTLLLLHNNNVQGLRAMAELEWLDQ